MADVCDYVYVSGLRFKSGDPYVEIPAGYLEALTGKTPQDPRALVRLSVVRDGKGASRTERWADKPARFGVTGEINLRDLGIILEKQGLQDIDAQVPLLIDGNQEVVPLVLNPSAGMGRRGRLIDPEAIEDLLMSLPDDTVQELIKDQLRNMPYGLENSRAAQERLVVLLARADRASIEAVAEEDRVDFMKHITREMVSSVSPERINMVLAAVLTKAATSTACSEAYQTLTARRVEVDLMKSAQENARPETALRAVPRSCIPYLDDDYMVLIAQTYMRARESDSSKHRDLGAYAHYAPFIKTIDSLELMMSSSELLMSVGVYDTRSNRGGDTDSFIELKKLLESRFGDVPERLEAISDRYPETYLCKAAESVLDGIAERRAQSTSAP